MNDSSSNTSRDTSREMDESTIDWVQRTLHQSSASEVLILVSSILLGILICILHMRLVWRSLQTRTDFNLFNDSLTLCIFVSGMFVFNNFVKDVFAIILFCGYKSYQSSNIEPLLLEFLYILEVRGTSVFPISVKVFFLGMYICYSLPISSLQLSP